jgi:hypothetical protein
VDPLAALVQYLPVGFVRICGKAQTENLFDSKLFTIAFSLNMIGLGLAASGHWPYARKYAGAMAVANFNFAILMRNEIFGRLLYLFVNTLFAKVCPFSSTLLTETDTDSQWTPLKWRLGCTSVLQVRKLETHLYLRG